MAVKVINKKEHGSPEKIRYFKNEFKIMKSVDHPHIIKCLHYEPTKNHLKFVLEKAELGDLEKFKGKLSENEALHVFR